VLIGKSCHQFHKVNFMPRMTASPFSAQLPKSTLDYLANGAPEGRRNYSAFMAAIQTRDARWSIEAATAVILPRALADGLKEHEIKQAIRSAYSKPAREPLGRGLSALPVLRYSRPQRTYPKRPSGLIQPLPLSEPIIDGDRVIIETCFKPGEFVSIGTTNFWNGCFTPDAGITYERNDLLRMLDKFNGITGIHWLSDPNGTYLRINPLRNYGRKDEDVTAFRHVLVEFDRDANGNPIPKPLQHATLLDSGMPMSVIHDSGNKSIHGWVNVDAKNLDEYQDRVAGIYAWFGDLCLDPHNKNASRYSRMPGVARNLRDADGNVDRVSAQTLLRANVGARNWNEWEREHR
jgi:hypothetical protein